MDEPFGALDAFTRDEMNLLIQKIWMETGKTIIFVTHNVTEAIFLADRVVVLTPRPGRLAHIFPIDLPRPRTIDMTFTPDFIKTVLEIKDTIETGVYKPISDETLRAAGIATSVRPGPSGTMNRRTNMASELRETIPTFDQAESRPQAAEVGLTNWSALTSAGFAKSRGARRSLSPCWRSSSSAAPSSASACGDVPAYTFPAPSEIGEALLAKLRPLLAAHLRSRCGCCSSATPSARRSASSWRR